MGVGLAAKKWPPVLDRGSTWPLFEGVSTYLLVAMGLLALLGLRYPTKMLPILIFEATWKLMWLAMIALPLWSNGQLDDAAASVASSCLWVVVVVAVTPWRYVFTEYVRRAGDGWRTGTAPRVGQP